MWNYIFYNKDIDLYFFVANFDKVINSNKFFFEHDEQTRWNCSPNYLYLHTLGV